MRGYLQGGVWALLLLKAAYEKSLPSRDECFPTTTLPKALLGFLARYKEVVGNSWRLGCGSCDPPHPSGRICKQSTSPAGLPEGISKLPKMTFAWLRRHTAH